MGVSGCGKSTVATAIAARAHAAFIEGDLFHPPQNIEKMSAGIPLTDSDRQGWLEQLAQAAFDRVATSQPVVLTCSALKRRYRDVLRHAIPDLGFVFLELSVDEAFQRVARRPGHFMPASLVDSQFRDLESPISEPRVLTLHATRPVDELADEAMRWWKS
jgi:gluconokinase